MRRLLVVVLMFSAFVWGCESNTLSNLADDSGRQSDVVEARMALDDGDYDKAVRILEDDYDPASPDPEVAGILASAYMGKAGLDLTYALENIGQSDGGHFDTIASALHLAITDQAFPASSQIPGTRELASKIDARYIAASSIAGFLESLIDAQSVLDALVEFHEGHGLPPDDDATVQLGIASALHFIMKTGALVSQTMGSNVPVNERAYREIFPEDSDWMSLLEDTSTYIDAHPEDLASLRTDLADVYDAILALAENIGQDEDLTRELDGFVRDLLGMSGSASEQSVTDAIDAYTGRDFAEFVHRSMLAYE